jgi:hypothetical protein
MYAFTNMFMSMCIQDAYASSIYNIDAIYVDVNVYDDGYVVVYLYVYGTTFL